MQISGSPAVFAWLSSASEASASITFKLTGARYERPVQRRVRFFIHFIVNYEDKHYECYFCFGGV